MGVRCLAITCSLALDSFIAGCGQGSIAGLEAPEQLILYSVDGRDFEPVGTETVGRVFEVRPADLLLGSDAHFETCASARVFRDRAWMGPPISAPKIA